MPVRSLIIHPYSVCHLNAAPLALKLSYSGADWLCILSYLARGKTKRIVRLTPRVAFPLAIGQATAGSEPAIRYLTALLNVVVFSALIRDGFSAVIRFSLYKSGTLWAWYLFDVAFIAVVFLASMARGVTHRAILASYAILVLLSVYSVLGYMYHDSPPAVVAGFKVWLPIAAIVATYDKRLKVSPTLAATVLALSALGLMLDSAGPMPWSDETLRINGVDKSAAINWYIGGVRRLAGFSGASYAAAIVVLACLWFWTISAQRRVLLTLGLWGLAVWAIYLTTTRSTLVAVTVGFAFLAAWKFAPPGLSKPFERLSSVVCALIATLIVAAPLVIYLSAASENFDARGSTGSVMQRAYVVWPMVLDYIDRNNGFWSGLGVGSIGQAPVYYDRSLLRFSFSDNVFLYTFAIFGFPALVNFLFLPYVFARYRSAAAPFCVAGLILGFFMNLVESNSGLVLLTFGLCWHLAEIGDTKRAAVSATRRSASSPRRA